MPIPLPARHSTPARRRSSRQGATRRHPTAGSTLSRSGSAPSTAYTAWRASRLSGLGVGAGKRERAGEREQGKQGRAGLQLRRLSYPSGTRGGCRGVTTGWCGWWLGKGSAGRMCPQLRRRRPGPSGFSRPGTAGRGHPGDQWQTPLCEPSDERPDARRCAHVRICGWWRSSTGGRHALGVCPFCVPLCSSVATLRSGRRNELPRSPVCHSCRNT
mmetsp:Transcript_11870/g.37941  ORF Transcript_11870/g.37941 Transcript_11870/m.37941 type:complete len:215 (+) Transcript_11870:2775-3419(+)